jgi:hypothetical protein
LEKAYFDILIHKILNVVLCGLLSGLFYPFVVSDKVDFIVGIAGHNIFI